MQRTLKYVKYLPGEGFDSIVIAGGARAYALRDRLKEGLRHVARSLTALDELLRKGLFDDGRLIDEVLFGSQFGDLPPETAEFVEYYQGLGDLRRGFGPLGTRRFEELAKSTRYIARSTRRLRRRT